MQVDLQTLDSVFPYLDDLSEVLIDVVEKGAGVSFLAPLSRSNADTYWRAQESEVASGQTLLFGSLVEGKLIGTVQLKRSWAPNQPHRSDISKLLVHSAYRRHGIATLLIRALEYKAETLNQKLLTFDASAHGHVEAFYKRLGYTCIGYYPNFALSSLGAMEDTALFYKQL